MSRKRTYKSYSQALKEEAAGLVTEQGYTIPKAAESIGIGSTQLYQWRKKQEQAKNGDFMSTDEKAELLA